MSMHVLRCGFVQAGNTYHMRVARGNQAILHASPASFAKALASAAEVEDEDEAEEERASLPLYTSATIQFSSR